MLSLDLQCVRPDTDELKAQPVYTTITTTATTPTTDHNYEKMQKMSNLEL